MKHFENQIQDGWMPSLILKKANLRYGASKTHFGQSEVPVQKQF